MRVLPTQAAERAAGTRPASRVAARLGEALILVALLAIWVAGVSFVRREPVTFELDLAGPPLEESFDRFGFYLLERNERFAYRWTHPYAFVQFPSAYHFAPQYVASVRAQTGFSDPNPVSFLGNEQPLAAALPDPDHFRTYHLLMPPPTADDPHLRLALTTEGMKLPGDPRKLGVVVSQISFRSMPYTDWPAHLLAGGVLLLWGLARWRGASPGGALLLCGPLVAALLALYVWVGPAPLQYTTLAGLSLGAAAVAVLLARPAPLRLGLALLGVVVSFSGMIWPSWLSDDAFISFHYAQNLVAGNGLVYNPGERVEGFTNFLYTMLAALVLALGGDPVYWAYLSGVVFALGLMLLAYRLASRLIGPWWAFVAALLVATSQSLLLHTARGSGLETGLFALLLLGSAGLYLRAYGPAGPEEGGHPGGPWLAATGAMLALATLTRPEGVLLLGILGLHLLAYDCSWRDMRGAAPILAMVRRKLTPVVWLVAPYLLVVVPFFLWRFSYYGDLLPNTFYAKTGGGLRAVPRGLAYGWGFAQTMGGPLLLLTLVGVAARGWAALRGWRGCLLLLLGVYTLYIVAVGGDHFRGDRFFVPLVAVIALLFADGLAHIFRLISARVPRPAAAVLLALVLSGYSGYALTRTLTYDYVIAGLDEAVWRWREIGWWMADNAGPDESIAVTGAGAIAYYGRRETIDMLGLTDRHIARAEMEGMGTGVPGHEKADPAYVLNVRRPTYIPQMWDYYFADRAALTAAYERIVITTRQGREVPMWRRRSEP